MVKIDKKLAKTLIFLDLADFVIVLTSLLQLALAQAAYLQNGLNIANLFVYMTCSKQTSLSWSKLAKTDFFSNSKGLGAL